MDKRTEIVLGVIAVILAGIGIIVALLAWLAPFGPLGPSPLSSENRSPEISETSNWAITFDYRFPSNFWAVGTHEYILEVVCPNLSWDDSGGRSTKSFEVSEDAQLLPGDVYLRPSGTYPALLGGEPVEVIHPSQPTTAAATVADLTLSDAEQIANDCRYTISWDGGRPQLLTADLPYEP